MRESDAVREAGATTQSTKLEEWLHTFGRSTRESGSERGAKWS